MLRKISKNPANIPAPSHVCIGIAGRVVDREIVGTDCNRAISKTIEGVMTSIRLRFQPERFEQVLRSDNPGTTLPLHPLRL